MSRKQAGVDTLLIQSALQKGKPQEEIGRDFHLRFTPHERFPGFYAVHHLGFNLNERLVQQCRGVILDANNNWEVIARPLDHIFEWSDPSAPKIDWAKKPRVLDKIDGYMLYMYHADGWFVGSRKSPDASDVVPGQERSLGELFWNTFHDMHYTVPPTEYTDYTFVWELRGPGLCPVVLRSESLSSKSLVLVAVRHNQTGEEIDPHSFVDKKLRNYITPWNDESRYITTAEALKEVVNLGLQCNEGVVVVAPDYTRIAVTHPDYNNARLFRQRLSVEWLVRNSRLQQTIFDIQRYAPDWETMHALIYRGLSDLIRRIWQVRDKLNEGLSDADFAQEIVGYPWAEVLLDCKRGNSSTIGEALSKIPEQTVLHWLEIPGRDELAA